MIEVVEADPPSELNLRVTPQELDYLVRVLYTRPYGEVYALVNKISQQTKEQ